MIQIGTCIKGSEFYTNLSKVAAFGFETVQLYFPDSLNGFTILDTPRIQAELEKNCITLDSIGLYCNPFASEENRAEMKQCLQAGAKLGISVFGTFAGAAENGTVEQSLPLFKKYFTEFLAMAKDSGIKIGIENYPAYGFWYNTRSNIGFCPRAWECMFNEITDDSLGLEWEPSHQIDQFIDPIPQLEKWAQKVVHVHGKDCHIDTKRLAEVGILSCLDYSAHRFPGFGDTDWKKVFKILFDAQYAGSVTIEGYHDPVYTQERELEGQSLARAYLIKCRNGAA